MYNSDNDAESLSPCAGVHTCGQVDGVVLSRTPALDGCAVDLFEFHPKMMG